VNGVEVEPAQVDLIGSLCAVAGEADDLSAEGGRLLQCQGRAVECRLSRRGGSRRGGQRAGGGWNPNETIAIEILMEAGLEGFECNTGREHDGVALET
jgi:hypothetical protein